VALVALVLSGTACAPDPPGSVVALIVDSCDPGQEIGSGILVDDDLVLTSAHVVAGARGITVRRNGVDLAGTIVGFDPEMDLAYVRVDGAPTRVLTVDSSGVERGDEGTAYVVRDGEVVTLPVRVRRRVNLRTEDVYIQGETLRPGLDLDADIRAGDSGGAVVVGGRIVGVLWARSSKFEAKAYAIDAVRGADRIRRQLREGRLGDDVDITRCH
jgi:S1-C subfamily serine protease